MQANIKVIQKYFCSKISTELPKFVQIYQKPPHKHFQLDWLRIGRGNPL